MKRMLSLALALMMLFSAAAMAEETLSENGKIIFDAVRCDMNLPKDACVLSAHEYLVKLNASVMLNALILKVSTFPLMENFYGNSAGIMVIDLIDGAVIDRLTVDENAMWPDGDITDKNLALNLLFHCYDAYTLGYNPFVMSEFEFLFPLAEDDIAAVNQALSACFLPAQ